MIEIYDTDLPITVADKIITGTRPYVATPLTKAVVKALTGDEKAGDTVDMFDLIEIKEIADYLMVYYESHKKGEPMRAIDADALIDDLKHDVAVDQDSLDYEELTDSNRENIQFDKDCKQNAIDLLQHAPTIEPQRKKGKWNFIGDQMFECSECGTYYTQSQFHQMRVRISDTEFPKFCPECGADMREPEDIPMEYFESGGR